MARIATGLSARKAVNGFKSSAATAGQELSPNPADGAPTQPRGRLQSGQSEGPSLLPLQSTKQCMRGM
jgi:hypothetical protein